MEVFLFHEPTFVGVVDQSGDAEASIGYMFLNDSLKSDFFLLNNAVRYLEKAVALKRKAAVDRHESDKTDLARALNNLGVQHLVLGNQRQASSLFQEALTHFCAAVPRDDRGIAGLRLNINAVSASEDR